MLRQLLHQLHLTGGETTAGGHSKHFVLRVVQPALVGLMDGSVSTLAPIFATAYATGRPHVAFLVGTAASLGAGISMGLAEGLSDDGELTGRGSGTIRGVITGSTTFLGGILHTLPFLLSDVQTALALAYVVVGLELVAIAVIRYKFMRTGFLRSVIQVVLGGAVVVAAGIALGHA